MIDVNSSIFLCLVIPISIKTHYFCTLEILSFKLLLQMALKNYETVFIVNPVLSEQQMKDTVAKFEDLVKSNGGDLYHTENWGMKKLAYQIDNKKSGFYHLMEYKAEPTFIKALETEFRRDEEVIRFLTVHLDKYAVEFNERRRNGKFNKKTEEAAS